MVCCDHIDDALIHCFQKGLAIGFGFDGRIPFHEIPFGQISLVVEPKMMYTSLAGDFFLQPVSAIEQSQLVGSTQMQNMQAAIVFPGQ